MSKAVSYYDWELSFKKKYDPNWKSEDRLVPFNSIGISDFNFREFLKKWKEKNLD